MTELQKDILISKMIEAVSSLSDDELDTIVHDEELREIYEMSSAVKGASLTQREFDMDSEWKLFQYGKLTVTKLNRWKWTYRVAAVILVVVCLSAIIIKIIDNTNEIERQPLIVEVQNTYTLKSVDSEKDVLEDSISSSEKIRSSEIKVNPKNTSKRTLAKKEESISEVLDDDDDLDIERYLRIQQADVDNYLAVQNAEIYMEEFEAIRELIGDDEYINETVTTMINKVTMQ